MIQNVLVVQHHVAVFPNAVHSLIEAGMTVAALNTVHMSDFLLRWSGATFDGLLLDAALNDGGAVELCSTLRRNGFSGVIVIFGAATDEDGLIRYLDAGADDVLATEIGLPEVVSRVRAHLRHRPVRQAPAAVRVARAA